VAKPGRTPRRWLRVIVGPPLAFVLGSNRCRIEPLFHGRRQHDLADELRAALAFLFQDREGGIIKQRLRPGAYPQAVEPGHRRPWLGHFWRVSIPDEYGVRAHAPNDSQDLPFALRATSPEAPVERKGPTSMSAISLHLKSGYDLLKLSFSAENFETTKQRIRHLEMYGHVLRA
jgi:hypothetical protein